jgi:beta-lactamase class A
MTSTVRFLTLLMYAGSVSAGVAAAQGAPPLPSRIASRIAEVPGAVVAVSFRDLNSGVAFDLSADSVFHAASTMKVPVMIQYFRDVESGRIRQDETLQLVNEFTSIADGSPFSVTPGDDSDSSLYQLVGQRVPVRMLVERMIARSSNLATNAVVARVGAARADSTAHALGARHMRVLRGVEDGKAYERGLNNVTAAPDLAALLTAIAEDRAATAERCREMLDILSRQEFNEEIPAGLPKGTRVAHKTGWITGVLHDAAIIFPPGRKPYVLVVLTRGIKDEKVARRLIVDLSRMIWDETVNVSRGRFKGVSRGQSVQGVRALEIFKGSELLKFSRGQSS